jgi:TetR/AcrR family transcriptional regulator
MMPPIAAPPADKTRDAERSREKILGAAEDLFAEKGFAGTSVGEIAAAAGLSRGTPSYFFGSKAGLYRAVLEGAFARREEATRRACAPLTEWATGERDDAIEVPLAEAVEGYLEFLLENPAFLRLVLREELGGAAALRDVPRASTAIHDAFTAVHSLAGSRGIGDFDPDDVVLLFVSLTFFPASQGSTFMASLKRDLSKPRVRRRHIELVVEQLLALIGAERG